MPRHVTLVPLRWCDVDAYGHVNNVVYLRYLQEARVDMLFVHAPRLGAKDLAAGVLVARHHVDYLAPLGLRLRPLRVETWVREVRNSTFTLGYEVLDDDEDRRVYATATTTLVPYDLAAGRPRRLKAEEKTVLHSYLELDGPAPAAAQRDQPERGHGTKTHVFGCAVRFDDLDSYGHVNNVTLVEYLQEARYHFAARHLHDPAAPNHGTVVAGQSIEYLAPVEFRAEPLQVEVWVNRIGTSSFDLGYEVRDTERRYARGSTALVAYDLRAQRSRELTERERAALELYLRVAS